MATKDFKVRHSLTVAENATIEGNLTLGGNTVSRVLDSDEVVGIINNNTSGFDSDQVVAIIGENPGSQTISTSIYTFTSPANDSDFSGTDDNGRTLGYTAGKIHVYLNGILLTETVDYTASNGSTVTLVNAPDSDDVLTVVKFLGTVQSGFDSEQVVAIINENVVSGSVDSDVAAVAALRRDADSDSIVIQKLRQDLDSESFQIRALRADVDSDANVIGTFLNDSDNNATLFATLSGPVTFLAKNDAGERLFPGTAVYIKGISGNKPTVDKANAGSSSTMPAFGIISEISNSGSEAVVTTFGSLENINTTGFTLGQTVYVSADSDGGLTTTKPTGASQLIQNIGIVTRVHQDSGSIRVGGAGRTNDIDNATRARLDSDSTVIQNHSGRINVLESRADSDSLVIQTLRGDVDTLQNVTHLDSESVSRVTDTQFTIVNNGASAYSFTGDGFPSSSDNPTLYLQRGHTYHFNVNASGHPFEIRLSNGGSAYSTGVTNNAAQVGRVVFTVPMDAPETLVYQCTVHSGMVGTIRIGKQGFDSDQIASMILENAGAGLTDSDLAVVSILRNDLDSETSRIEQLRRDLDSESAVIRQLRAEQDSDSINSGGSGGGAAGFDSDQVVAIISENAASNSIVVTTFVYTSPARDSDFSGADDNGRTLSYVPQKIDVYLNGILLSDTTDYLATNGTTVTLVNAPDSDDVLTVKRYFGTENTSQTLNIERFDYTATQGQLVFTGSDDNSNTLSYTTGKVQVYLNGILLLQTEDYLDSDGATITLTSGADSDDKLSIIKYLGTVQANFDSDQIVAIINENTVAGGSVDSDVAAIAQLRRDADSDSLVIQQLREALDSEILVIRQLRLEQDSDSANSGGASSGGGAAVDSDYIIARQIVDAKHYNYSGTLATNTGSKRLYMHRDGVLGTFDMHVATAPVGAAINITVKKNGSSIGTGTITSGNTDNNLQTLSTTTFDSGDYLTVDITQIGTTTAGEDLYVVFRIVG